jgi:hypothetical protein
MATTCPLPDAAKVTSLIGMLFEGLDVKPGGSFDRTPAGGAWIGVFVADCGNPIALCGADLNLSASLGAALSMVPPAAVKDAVKSRELSGVMIDNLREVMNIATRLVMSDTSAHLKLEQVYPVKALPAPAAALLRGSSAHVEFQVQLPRYGGGVLSLLST